MKNNIIKRWSLLLLLIGVTVEITAQNSTKKDSNVGGLGNPCPVGVDCEGDFFNPRLVVKKKVDISVNEIEKPKEKAVLKEKVIVKKNEIPLKNKKAQKPIKKEEVLVVKKVASVKNKILVKKEIAEVDKKRKQEGPPDGWDAPPTGLGFDEFLTQDRLIRNDYILPANSVFNSGSSRAYIGNYSR